MQLQVTGTPKDIVAELGLVIGGRYLIQIRGFSALYLPQAVAPARTDGGHDLVPGGELAHAGIEVGALPVWVWSPPLQHPSQLIVSEAP